MAKEKKKGRKKGEAVKILALAVIFGMMIFSGLSMVFINSATENQPQNYLNNGTTGTTSGSSEVPCLAQGVKLRQNFQVNIAMSLGGQPQPIPAGIGISQACTSELNTSVIGVINVQAQDDRQYTLGDFFNIWGQSFYIPGYNIKMTVNGKTSTQLDNLVLKSGQNIVLTYSSSTIQ